MPIVLSQQFYHQETQSGLSMQAHKDIHYRVVDSNRSLETLSNRGVVL